MDIQGLIQSMFAKKNQQSQGNASVGAQPQQPQAPTPVYSRVQGGAMVNGGQVPDYPGLTEDSFSFPNGGSFDRTPSSIGLNGAYVPNSLGLQEDSFTFQQPQGNARIGYQPQPNYPVGSGATLNGKFYPYAQKMAPMQQLPQMPIYLDPNKQYR